MHTIITIQERHDKAYCSLCKSSPDAESVIQTSLCDGRRLLYVIEELSAAQARRIGAWVNEQKGGKSEESATPACITLQLQRLRRSTETSRNAGHSLHIYSINIAGDDSAALGGPCRELKPISDGARQ